MNLEQRMISPFVKAKYLSEENYKRYTSIINYLYRQHEYFYAPPSLPSDIYDFIKESDHLLIFEEYTEQQLDGDLRQLEEWGNVKSHADNSRVTRIQDYNRSRLRYECADETIEIERMLEKLEGNIHKIKGSLDPKMVDSLVTLVLRFQKMTFDKSLSKDERSNVNELWTDIIDRFNKLREESSDYLGTIQSKNIEAAMQNKDIGAFRVKFTEYLHDFITSLHKHSIVIEFALKEIQKKGLVDKVIVEMIKLQKDRPSFEEDILDVEMAEIYINQWNGIQAWFIADEFGERYIDYLFRQTNETIRKFLKALEQLAEREQQVKNRKYEFLHLAKLFEEEEEFDTCLKVFGAITNIEKPPHLFSDKYKKIYADKSITEHDPEVNALQGSRKAGVRMKRKLTVTKPTEEEQRILAEALQENLYKESQIEAFTQRGKVVIGEIGHVEGFILDAILNWISRANSNKTKSGRTDNGVSYRIKKSSNRLITVQTSKGILTMDDYIIYFEV